MLFADEELSQQVASVIAQIRKRNATVSVAESLTGGLLAAAFVAVPGVSDIFCGGAVTYTNEMKIKVLGVDSELLACGGAVQAEVAAQMASGIAKLYGTEFAIATTGVAGPGASAGKAAGTVFIGVKTPDAVTVCEYHFSGDRQQVRMQSVAAAISLIFTEIVSK